MFIAHISTVKNMYLIKKKFYWLNISKAINNKIAIHSNYVNDEFEAGQKYTYVQMLHKSMFIQNTNEWQKSAMVI